MRAICLQGQIQRGLIVGGGVSVEPHPFDSNFHLHAKIWVNVIKFGIPFVCVEVLRPSELKGVMSSAVSLPNNTFTGLA